MMSQVDEANPAVSANLPRASAGLAFLGLAIADVIMKLAGFQRLYKTVQRWPVSKKTSNDSEAIAATCAAVDRAARRYLKHTLCLQRSAITTCLLRMRGIRAEMVIGCRKI